MKIFREIFFKQDRDPRLFGEWNSIIDSPESEKVKMTFYPDGKLLYQIISNEKTQIFNLTFYTKNGLIVSNQPSKPKEESTRYYFENNYSLTLPQSPTHLAVRHSTPLPTSDQP